MMTSEYVTVYQISKQSTDWFFALLGAIPLIVGIGIILAKNRFKWQLPHWLMPIVLCGFGLLWLCITGTSVLREDSQALTAYKEGNYQLVEGNVKDFQPMPYEGHQLECFSVQDKRFCYSDYVIAPGFRNTASHGGPIHSGLPVRIAYLGGVILRLDLPKDQVLTPTESAAMINSAQRQWQRRAENDPFEQHIRIAFLFTAMCWTLWWNLQWKKVMRFWVRPPNRLWVQYLARAFFALNFIGALQGLVQQLRTHPLANQDVGPTLEITAIMCVVVALMSGFGLWMVQRRDREQTASQQP
jgi:hypothetical protein